MKNANRTLAKEFTGNTDRYIYTILFENLKKAETVAIHSFPLLQVIAKRHCQPISLLTRKGKWELEASTEDGRHLRVKLTFSQHSQDPQTYVLFWTDGWGYNKLNEASLQKITSLHPKMKELTDEAQLWLEVVLRELDRFSKDEDAIKVLNKAKARQQKEEDLLLEALSVAQKKAKQADVNFFESFLNKDNENGSN